MLPNMPLKKFPGYVSGFSYIELLLTILCFFILSGFGYSVYLKSLRKQDFYLASTKVMLLIDKVKSESLDKQMPYGLILVNYTNRDKKLSSGYYIYKKDPTTQAIVWQQDTLLGFIESNLTKRNSINIFSEDILFSTSNNRIIPEEVLNLEFSSSGKMNIMQKSFSSPLHIDSNGYFSLYLYPVENKFKFYKLNIHVLTGEVFLKK